MLNLDLIIFIYFTFCISLVEKKRSPVGIYLLKVSNQNTTARCEICSKLTITTPEQQYWHRFGVFVVNFENI